jgi:hypothetical protein
MLSPDLPLRAALATQIHPILQLRRMGVSSSVPEKALQHMVCEILSPTHCPSVPERSRINKLLVNRPVAGLYVTGLYVSPA